MNRKGSVISGAGGFRERVGVGRCRTGGGGGVIRKRTPRGGTGGGLSGLAGSSDWRGGGGGGGGGGNNGAIGLSSCNPSSVESPFDRSGGAVDECLLGDETPAGNGFINCIKE